jgi:hypothetical protein
MPAQNSGNSDVRTSSQLPCLERIPRAGARRASPSLLRAAQRPAKATQSYRDSGCREAETVKHRKAAKEPSCDGPLYEPDPNDRSGQHHSIGNGNHGILTAPTFLRNYLRRCDPTVPIREPRNREVPKNCRLPWPGSFGTNSAPSRSRLMGRPSCLRLPPRMSLPSACGTRTCWNEGGHRRARDAASTGKGRRS